MVSEKDMVHSGHVIEFETVGSLDPVCIFLSNASLLSFCFFLSLKFLTLELVLKLIMGRD